VTDAYPFVDAYEDSSIGLHGGHNRMPWISVIDAAGDDPYAPVYDAAPIGAAHPLPRMSGLVVVGYDTAQLLGGPDDELTYKVYVNYGPASDRTIGLWRRSVRFASDTKMLAYSLPEYYANGTLKTPRYLIGSYKYEGTDVAANPEYYADQSAQKLKRTAVYQQKEMPVNHGISAIIYEILVPQLSAKKLREIHQLKWHTNQYDWLGHPYWSLQFSNYAIDDEVLSLPGNRGTTAAWYSNVMLEILMDSKDKALNPYGFRAEVRQDEWTRDDGTVAPVTQLIDGTKVSVTRTFVKYPQVSFSNLFGILGYGSPAN
jgi:hypothetical protein